MNNDNDAILTKALRFSDRITQLKCRLGLHTWEAFVDNLRGRECRSPVTIVFWVCRHCAESKLKCILPNGHKPV